MGVFDYRDYSAQKSVDLVLLTHQLATYGSVDGILLPQTRDIINGLLRGFGPLLDHTPEFKLPEGWRELTAAELGLPDDAVDDWGYFRFNSTLTGDAAFGPQVKLLGEFDESGALLRISVTWAGTNWLTDIPDYFKLNEGEIAPEMEPLLRALADYMTAQGLDGSDALITGYSLGGAYTNIMARFRDTLADGFFADSDYIGHAAAVTHEDGSVLNVGYENDVVHRIGGDQPDFMTLLQNDTGLLSPPDWSLDSANDNLVIFNGAYASPLWPFGQFSLINLVSWYSHIHGATTDALDRIAGSEFYDLMNRDSRIVISGLGADLRWSAWVEDKATDRHDPGEPVFLIGTQWGDKLRDNRGGDYIEGLGGDDLIRVSAGADTILGGAGEDTLRLTGDAQDWLAFRLDDGALVLFSRQGDGIKLVSGVEHIEFEGWSLFGESLVNTRYSIQSDRLEDEHWSPFEWGDRDLAYTARVEGTDGADALSGRHVFGGAGDDALTGTGAGVLHGGAGDDVLVSGGGDALYGAEGDDRLIASTGREALNGGLGDDSFVFAAGASGEKIIEEFDSSQADDVVEIAAALTGDPLAALSQQGADVVGVFGDLTLRFTDTQLSDFTADDFILI